MDGPSLTLRLQEPGMGEKGREGGSGAVSEGAQRREGEGEWRG